MAEPNNKALPDRKLESDCRMALVSFAHKGTRTRIVTVEGKEVVGYMVGAAVYTWHCMSSLG